ncbi:MAG: glycosyltransferase family 4 protein [Candidatus Desantisbacteria bacterium]
MRILFIHQYFLSPNEAGGTRHFEMARYLVKHGHKVSIITSKVSYLTGTVKEKYKRRFLIKEEIEGVEIIRAWTYSKVHKSFKHRILGFFSFVALSIWTSLFIGKYDVVIATSPPLFQGISGWIVSKLKRCPFIFEIRDLWPAFAIDMGELTNPTTIKLAMWLENFLYTKADYFISLTPAYSEYLIENRVEKEKIFLIPNGVETDTFFPMSRDNWVRQEYKLNDKFVLAYGGAHGIANDLDTILDCAKYLKEHPDIVFLLIGDGKEKKNLIKRKDVEEIDNLIFIHAQPKEKMPYFYAASDVCIATLQGIGMFKKVYPNKLFDYMASARPTILAIDGEARKILEKANGGVYIEPKNPEDMANAVLRLYGNRELCEILGRNARDFVVREFTRQKQAEKLISMLKKTIGSNQC